MMKAVRFHGQKDIRLDEVEVPKCGKGQVKVSGLRLSDTHKAKESCQGETSICRDMRDRYISTLVELLE